MTTNNNFNRMDDKLDQALARLAVGAPVEVILAEAGNDAEQLRPLLEIAAEVANLKLAVPIPPPEASLQKLLAHGEKLTHSTWLPAAARPGWLVNLLNIFNGGFRLAAGLATAMLLFLVMGGTVYVAAQRSLPGDSLYRLKQVSERVQLNLAGDSLRREQLSQMFNQRRRAEIEALLNQGKSAEVAFESQVQAVNASTIMLDGLTVQLGPETQIVGQPTARARVRVQVRTLPPNNLLALTITVIEPGLPPTPSPTPTFTATPPKAQATDTLPPTATLPKAQATDTIVLPPTPSPTPTARPTQPPLLTGDNLNDNSRADDFNQNSDDNVNDNADENTDFDDDNFNDNDDEFNDDDRDSNSNDNSRDDNDNDDDRSGRGGDGSNDDSDDNGDDGDDDNSDDDSDDDDN